MRKGIIAAFLLVIVAASFTAGKLYQKKQVGLNDEGEHHKVLYYTDPMNPGAKFDKPGVAPCGMPLEPVYAEGPSVTFGMPPGTIKVSPEQQQLIGVKVGTVEKAPFSHEIRVPGKVVPDETRVYRLGAVTDGWIKKILPITTGSLVKKDELLATFYAPAFFSAIKAYLYGLRSLERFESSGKETKEQIEVTNANIDSYRISLRELGMSEHQIDEIRRTREIPNDIEIRAPEAGFIIVRNIWPGQRMEKGTELYRVADLTHVWVLATIFENEAKYFRQGMLAKVVAPNQGKTFPAKVSNVLPQFDAASRTLKIRLELDNPGFLLRPDMFVDVEIPVTFPASISVPVDAVRYSGIKKTVFIDLGNGFFEPRNVETGWTFGDRVEIVKGLMPGERIVTSGNFLIDSESRMKAAPEVTHRTAHAEKCPVCGMDVDSEASRVAGRIGEYKGKTYYFCSEKCKKDFNEAIEHRETKVDKSHAMKHAAAPDADHD